MQPADPETRDISRDRNACRAPPFRQSDPRPHSDAACPRKQRARGNPRLAEDKSVHAKIQKRRKFKKPEVRGSAYSGSATKPALVSVIGLFAEASVSGARPSAARASLMVKMPFDV